MISSASRSSSGTSVTDKIPGCRVYDIASELGITTGGTSKLVDRIEASGYCRSGVRPGIAAPARRRAARTHLAAVRRDADPPPRRQPPHRDGTERLAGHPDVGPVQLILPSGDESALAMAGMMGYMSGSDDSVTLPVINVSPLMGPAPAVVRARVAGQIQAACRDRGFFYVTGHGVPADLLGQLADASAEFFALPLADKLEIAMERGGRAWRGFFPVGAELTSGRPDLKEGLYFGAELPADDPRVLAKVPLHGANLFPRQVPRLRPLVLAYLDALASVGQAVLAGVALSLGLDAGYFATGYTADPTILFRIFHYPPSTPQTQDWGVGEHTDYGLVTLLAQDDSGGLQIAAPAGGGRRWIDAPPIPGTLVCNIGDMLDRLTAGWYRSTPHRVRNLSGHGRLSFPFFLDPGFDAEVPPLPSRAAAADDGRRRWDGQDLRAFTGTYGDYLLGKVSKVFPQLREDVLD